MPEPIRASFIRITTICLTRWLSLKTNLVTPSCPAISAGRIGKHLLLFTFVASACTSKGLKAALICKKYGYTATPLSNERIFDAVDVLLLYVGAPGSQMARFVPWLVRPYTARAGHAF